MSKCREAFAKEFTPKCATTAIWDIWQAAWNARGKVDAEICETMYPHDVIGKNIRKAIEQEDEK